MIIPGFAESVVGCTPRINHERKNLEIRPPGSINSRGDESLVNEVVAMAESHQDTPVSVWRDVDVTVGQRMETCRTIWNANSLSDGCSVEFVALNRNV